MENQYSKLHITRNKQPQQILHTLHTLYIHCTYLLVPARGLVDEVAQVAHVTVLHAGQDVVPGGSGAAGAVVAAGVGVAVGGVLPLRDAAGLVQTCGGVIHSSVMIYIVIGVRTWSLKNIDYES